MSVRTALVGYGHSGQFLHAPFIKSAGLDLALIVSSKEELVHQKFPDVEVMKNFESLITRTDIDLVVLATPNEFHVDQAARALRSGKHVVIDKPFCDTAESAAELIAISEQEGLKLSCYHNRRWDSDYLTLCSLLESGVFGKVHLFEARWDRFRPKVRDRWRERPGCAAGLLFDLGPHLIDQAIQLFGMPDSLQANVATQRDGSTVDDCFDILFIKDQMQIKVGASCLAADTGFRYRILGEQASFTKHGLDLQEDHIRAGMEPSSEYFGAEPKSQFGILKFPDGTERRVPSKAGNWTAFYLALSKSIKLEEPLPVSAHEAMRVIATIEQVSRSSAEGIRVNNLPTLI